MSRIVGSGWVAALLVVAAWRGASELVARWRELAASGELARRLELRRIARIEHALERARVRVPVLVPAFSLPGSPAIDPSVYVGRVAGDDHDDVGLLEGAMRRAARERMGVDADGVSRREVDRTDWVSVLADAHDADSAESPAIVRSALATLLAATGVGLTLVPLVRPLADVAPWLAAAGAALVAAAWFTSRRD